MDKFVPIYVDDGSFVSIEHVNVSRSVEMHKHDFFEFFLIETGSCRHFFNGHESLLIPGDSFLVPAYHNHSFTIHKSASILNCQFYPEKIKTDVSDIFNITKMYTEKSDSKIVVNLADHQANINKQGIIHLNSTECAFVLSIIGNMQEEQTNQENNFRQLKQKYLEILLLILKRISDCQFKNYPVKIKRHQSVMRKVLGFIEKNISDDIDFTDLMEHHGFSPNHFRKIFKDFTGLSPVDYVNRLRIVKACDYLQNTNIPIGEIAGHVGIYDSNYFTRLFKQYMGFTPKQYIILSRQTETVQQGRSTPPS
jgi:YesN/AraC family two-component response regulator